jgi:hypothetical protein
MAVCWCRMSMAVSRADSSTRRTSPRRLAPASSSDGRSAGVSVEAALVAIIGIAAQSIIVTVSRVQVWLERGIDRVQVAVLRGGDRLICGRLRRVVAVVVPLVSYWCIFDRGGRRGDNGQDDGKSKGMFHEHLPPRRALLAPRTVYWIMNNGCQLLDKNGGNDEGLDDISGLRPHARRIGSARAGGPDSSDRRSQLQRTAREIAALFRQKTGHKAILITGASGALS